MKNNVYKNQVSINRNGYHAAENFLKNQDEEIIKKVVDLLNTHENWLHCEFDLKDVQSAYIRIDEGNLENYIEDYTLMFFYGFNVDYNKSNDFLQILRLAFDCVYSVLSNFDFK